MPKSIRIGLLWICFFTPLGSNAGDKFTWKPVTSADWNLLPDSARGIRDAVMIFEHIVQDDHDLLSDHCHRTLYRRIKIFNSEGRKWGEVKLPYVNKDEEIKKIFGRTLIPGGQEFTLSEAQIHQDQVLKSEDQKIMQKSFSLPGITDGCIIEYYAEYDLPSPNFLWLPQKDIVLLHGEYHWLIYNGQNMNVVEYNLIRDEYTPNYLWLNAGQRVTSVEQLPNIKEPEEVVFKIENVPAFEEEPYSLANSTLLAQLRLYYGKAAAPGAYWGESSQKVQGYLEKFTKDDDRSRKVIASWGKLDSLSDKITTAYSWIQSNMKSISYEKDQKQFKSNENINDVLEHRYGSSEELNLTFYNMLRDLNVDAKMVYVLHRDEGILVTEAKYWQFDGTLVVANDASGQRRFYSPGYIFSAQDEIPWFYEGTPGLVVGDPNQQFTTIAFSRPEQNRDSRSLTLSLGADSKLHGKFLELCNGQAARSLRVLAYGETDLDRRAKLRDELLSQYPDAELDSLSVAGLDSTRGNVAITCQMVMPNTHQLSGNRLIFRPFGSLSKVDNPFQSEIRALPILFKYADVRTESMSFPVPDGYVIESLPTDTSFKNEVGSCDVTFSSFAGAISAQRMFRLNKPFWAASNYQSVRELFQMRQRVDGLVAVLKKR